MPIVEMKREVGVTGLLFPKMRFKARIDFREKRMKMTENGLFST